MSTTKRKYGVFAVIIAVLSLAVVGCGGKETPITVPEGAQTGELVGMESCTYEAKDIEYAADCGTLVVPENRSDPDSRLIALPVTRIRATGNNPTEPAFWLAGGPGASNMKFSPPEELLESHDIIMVGYRGVDGTVVLECPEVTQAIKDANPDFLNQESLANIGDAWAGCSARLEAEGIDLDGYTMVETIEDNEAARVALGYEHINLLGGSYGTLTEVGFGLKLEKRVVSLRSWDFHPEIIKASDPADAVRKALGS